MDDLDRAIKVLDEHIEKVGEVILRGQPEDYAEYKYHVGQLHVLRLARGELVDMRDPKSSH